MELLLAYVKTHSSRCFSPQFLRQLFLVMVSTEVWLHPTHHAQSQLVRLYAQRIFRCIYDKSDDEVSSPRRQIILTLVDMLELFQERCRFFASPHSQPAPDRGAAVSAGGGGGRGRVGRGWTALLPPHPHPLSLPLAGTPVLAGIQECGITKSEHTGVGGATITRLLPSRVAFALHVWGCFR